MSVTPARASTWGNLPWCGEGRVAYGDTITVLDADRVRHKIRLAGIDAPEKKQAFGNRSKEKLSELAFDKTVDVETGKRDRYGRQIGKVLVSGRDINLVQVERGMAWFYRHVCGRRRPALHTMPIRLTQVVTELTGLKAKIL